MGLSITGNFVYGSERPLPSPPTNPIQATVLLHKRVLHPFCVRGHPYLTEARRQAANGHKTDQQRIYGQAA